MAGRFFQTVLIDIEFGSQFQYEPIIRHLICVFCVLMCIFK